VSRDWWYRAGTAASLIANVRDAREAKRDRWQGFLVSFGRAASNPQQS
jgi:hypothetical protein